MDAGLQRPIELRTVKLAAPGEVVELDASPVSQNHRATRAPSVAKFAAIPQPGVPNEGRVIYGPCAW